MIAGVITARGGSIGLPRKNILPLGGRPLIAWAIAAALASTRLDKALVSTDDDEIARAAEQAGAWVPFRRPAAISAAASPHMLAVRHALDWLRGQAFAPRYVVLIQPTSPLLTAADIDAAVDLAVSLSAPAVVSVAEAHPHPFKIYRDAGDGTLVPFLQPGLAYARRQDLPLAYAENGAIYVLRADLAVPDGTFLPPGTRPYVMPAERSIDVDTEWDLFLAEAVMRRNGIRG